MILSISLLESVFTSRYYQNTLVNLCGNLEKVLVDFLHFLLNMYYFEDESLANTPVRCAPLDYTVMLVWNYGMCLCIYIGSQTERTDDDDDDDDTG